MSLQRLQVPYLASSQRTSVVINSKDIVLDTDLNKLFVGDGVSSGGQILLGGGVGALQGSGSYVQSNGTIQFANSNGITFGLTNNVMTASHNGLTTGALSNHTHSDLYIPLGNSTAYQTGTLSNTFQTTGAYLTTAALSNHTHSDLYQSTGAYLTTAALSGHTHSDLYIPLGNSTYYQVSNLSNSLQVTGAYLTTAALSNHTHSDLYQSTGAYLTTAALSGHTHSDLYIPLGESTAYRTATLSTALMPLSYSSGFQTATLSNTFAQTGHTHSDLYIAKGDSTAYQTGTLANTFMDKSYSSAFQTATLANTFMDKSYSSAFQTATLANTFMDKSYSSDFQTATLSNTFQTTGAYLTTAALSGHTHSDLYQSTGAYLTTAAQSGHTHGAGQTASTAGSELLFTTASNSWQLGVPKWITTAAAAPATWSFYQNLDFRGFASGASALTQTSGSSIYIQQLSVPYHLSVSYVRMLMSFNASAVGTAGTTQANTSFSCERYSTVGLVVYTQGAGVNAQSLQSVSSTSVGFTARTKLTAGAQATQYTMSIEFTYPASGAINGAYGSSYGVSSNSIVLSSNSNTLFTGQRWLDIPFEVSFAPGMYWIGIGGSTASASNSSNISFVGASGMALSLGAVTQSALSVGLIGAATSASAYQLNFANGVWTTNAANWSTASVAVSQISQIRSNHLIPMQFIRQA